MGIDAAIDVTPEERQTVLALLQRHLPGTAAWVYGSRAKWTSTPTSDLDLVVFATPEQRPQVGDLREALEESNLPFRVDLFVWDDVPESFRRGIEADKAPLVGHEAGDGRTVRVAATGRRDPDGWRIRRFAELLDGPVRNGIYKSKEHHGNGVKIVNMGELFAHPRLRAVPMRRVRLSESETDRFSLTRGDLLFARRSLVAEGAGKCSVVLDVDEPTAFESSIIRARPAAATSDPLYLYYFFSSPPGLHRLDTIRRQVAVAGITGRDLSALEILAPPLSEQRAIAHVLGTLDDKIELNHRMSATLEAMARALFRSWFVDFDPVRSKMEGRDTGLRKEIADLFPDRLVSSDGGEAPEGWPVEDLAGHFEVMKGVSYKGSDLGKNGTPLHNLNSIHEGGGYKYEGIKFYSGEYAERHCVLPGDVIVANTEQGHDRLLIGYAAMVPGLFGTSGIASHHIYRLRPRSTSWLSTRFLLFLLNSDRMHDLVSRYANGTTVNMLPNDGVQRPSFVVPPTRLANAFDLVVSNTEQRREQAVRESRTLMVVRDAILPKLVSGELRVREAERLVGAIV